MKFVLAALALAQVVLSTPVVERQVISSSMAPGPVFSSSLAPGPVFSSSKAPGPVVTSTRVGPAGSLSTGIPVPTTGSPTSCLFITYPCYNLVDKCINESPDWVANPWSKKSCVGAATCIGVGNLVSFSRCVGYPVPDVRTLPNLDYNLYASVVGDCAWASGGCPITPQNYVDFIFNTFTSGWPESGQWVVDNWWNPIVQWAATGPSIPYTNFNDWLHFSSS